MASPRVRTVAQCADCKRDGQKIIARKLCSTCWNRHSRAGTLERFAASCASGRRGPLADSQYRAWMLSEPPRVLASEVAGWVQELVDEHDGQCGAASAAEIDEAIVRNVLTGARKRVTYTTAERIATATGNMAKLIALVPAAGADGWSGMGRNCGDGSEGRDGCGTWFHKHYANGLCRECFDREHLGIGHPIPRDVRVSMEVMR